MSTGTAALIQRVQQLVREEIAPAMQMDGTSVEVCRIEGGIAFVKLDGACGSCPSSVMAVLMGIEQELRQRISEIEFVELEMEE